MASRKARTLLTITLALVGASGGYFALDAYGRHSRLLAGSSAVLSRLDAMLAAVNELAATQRSYFEPDGEGRGSQAARVQRLAVGLRRDLGALRREVGHSVERVSVLSAALEKFERTDTRVRANLANDAFYVAADLVFAASAGELRAVTAALGDIRAAEMRALSEQGAGAWRQLAWTLGAVGVTWTIGLLLLWPLPPRTSGDEPQAVGSAPAGPLRLGIDGARPQPGVDVDLAAFATVCSQIAAAASTDALSTLLGEAATLGEIEGMIVWLGVEDTLVPALGHGYDHTLLARIGPLHRDAENATSEAWRTATPHVVKADASGSAAVVVPLISASGCHGVLAMEVRPGREERTETVALATLLAAQLSTLVSSWPDAKRVAPLGPDLAAMTLPA
jgi:hypothetical protein